MNQKKIPMRSCVVTKEKIPKKDLDQNLEKAKKIESDENELLNIKGDDSLEKQKEKIETIIIPPLNIISDEI